MAWHKEPWMEIYDHPRGECATTSLSLLAMVEPYGRVHVRVSWLKSPTISFDVPWALDVESSASCLGSHPCSLKGLSLLSVARTP